MKKNTKKTVSTNLRSLAEKYRIQHQLNGGLVVIHKGHVVGWINDLKQPNYWKPGRFAVNETGRIWTSVGGSQDEGAESWQPQNERF